MDYNNFIQGVQDAYQLYTTYKPYYDRYAPRIKKGLGVLGKATENIYKDISRRLKLNAQLKKIRQDLEDPEFYKYLKQHQSKQITDYYKKNKASTSSATTSSKKIIKGSKTMVRRKVSRKGLSVRLKRKDRDRRKWKFRGSVRGRAINVKADREGYSRSFYKQKVTTQQQRKINRCFKDRASPLIDSYEKAFQDTIPMSTDKCKWIFRCHNNLNYLMKPFTYFPWPGATAGTHMGQSANVDYYYQSPEQSIYYAQFKTKYEIYNPTNYDLNLIIYDIVCKQDTTDATEDNYYSYGEADMTGYSTSRGNPIRLIELGLQKQTGLLSNPTDSTEVVNTTSYTLVANSNDKHIYTISLKPTESYPFNIYWTIVKKHTFKLQPGATMTHTFIHKPKALMNLGYMGYRYGKDLKMSGSNLDGDAKRGIKGITSGCLFKYWGQVTGTAESVGTGTGVTQDTTQVVNLSGRIMFKEFVENKAYAIAPKYKYTWSYKNEPTISNEETLPVVNDVTIKPAEDDLPTGEGSTEDPAN